MQVPIASGIYTNEASDYRIKYPVNLVPIAQDEGISNLYLKPADGIVGIATGYGVDRGGINWKGVCYRVSGSKLITVTTAGVVVVLGDVGGTTGQCSFDYSTDRLAIASNGNLFYWNGATLSQVIDTDIGTVNYVIWVDGYFMTTDSNYLIVTDLADPMSVNPLKYGSSEVDPDIIQSMLKVRNEVYAINRFTIEVFNNVGGSGFPFQRVPGAMIPRGAIGVNTSCLFMDTVTFMGSGRNENVSVWSDQRGVMTKLATREIDLILSNDYAQSTLKDAVVEKISNDGHEMLYIHLPDKTLCYDAQATQIAGFPIWYILTTSTTESGIYKARNFVRLSSGWIVGDPSSSAIGTLSKSVGSHWGTHVGWSVQTSILYNSMKQVLIHELELIALTGRVSALDNPTISTAHSNDGETWSTARTRSAGLKDNRLIRLNWLQCGMLKNWRIQKFWGLSDAHISISALEVRAEPLNV